MKCISRGESEKVYISKEALRPFSLSVLCKVVYLKFPRTTDLCNYFVILYVCLLTLTDLSHIPGPHQGSAYWGRCN